MAGSKEGLKALNGQLDAKKEGADQQKESIDKMIATKQDEQDNYKWMLDDIDTKMKAYNIESLNSEENFYHTHASPTSDPPTIYYAREIDSETASSYDMTSWTVFTYIIKSSTTPITIGVPTGYFVPGTPPPDPDVPSGGTPDQAGICYDSSGCNFYMAGDQRTLLSSGGSTKACQCVDSSSIVYIDILCTDYWRKSSSDPYYTIVKYSILADKQGQTYDTFESPISIMNQNYWLNDGPNWGSLPQERKDAISKFITDFMYAHDNIFLPIGLTGTYGTKDNIAKLKQGSDLQQSNSDKYSGGADAFGNYI